MSIMILGAYGNFGKRIAIALAKENILLILAGRNKQKLESLFHTIKKNNPHCQITTSVFDINDSLSSQLEKLKPKIIINTCGPFQTSDYSVAKSCIEQKIHYIDLADAREFVNNISSISQSAKDNDVLVVSGASTVPALSSAVLDHYKNYFSKINSLIYGISPGQKAERGLATTKAILSYLGKPFKLSRNNKQKIYGWQNLYRQDYPTLGKRWMANCDIPDLDLFPKKYAIDLIQFSAGMENTFIHLSLWCLSWLIRLGFPINLSKYADKLLHLSNLFNSFGTDAGGMHMIMKGTNKEGKLTELRWFIIAKNADGPQIPCVPAIILAKKLIANKINIKGAFPCVGMITLEEYLRELKQFSIKQYVFKE